MTQRVKRAIAAAMSLTMLAAATPVSPLYNAIQNAVSSVTMQASAADNKYIENYDNDTFSIASFGDLNRFAEAVNDGYTFENKTITLADNFDMGTGSLGNFNALGSPIGTYAHRFMGTFDGNNKTINLDFSEFTYSSSYAHDYAGLFGYVECATIRNITVTGYEFCIPMNGDDCYAGGICGYADSSNIYNCTNNNVTVKAKISSGSNYYAYAGGICGCAYSSNIYNCTNNATVEAQCIDGSYFHTHAGGICGVADSSNIYNCTNNAIVLANHADYSYAGGICGDAYYVTVYNCTNNAAVKAGYAGGISGYVREAYLSVYNCTNNAAVKAYGDYGYAGGILGYAFLSSPLVHNCIDTGRNGIICGSIHSDPLKEPDIDNCYVLTESNAEQFKGTQKVDEKTIIEHLNTYVDKFNSTPSNDITLLKWEQGQDYPIFKQETRVVGASLSLGGQIGVNISFYVNKDEGSTITINDETVDLAQLTSVNGIYTYTLWVAPKDAYNDITFKAVKGSDTIVKQTYSVQSQYVDFVLSDIQHTKYNQKVFSMVTALDAYINYARVYFGIETDSDKITEINYAIDSNTKSIPYPYEIETPVFNETMYYGSSLILDSGVKVRHYIKIADGTDISKFKLAVNGNDITDAELTKSGIKSGSDDVYFFETDEFNPIDFDKKVSVTYDGTNVIDKYSVLSYIQLAHNNLITMDTKLGTMCRALYNYYLKAGTY